FRLMATQQLEFRTDDPLFRQIGDEVMTKEVRIDAFGNPSRQRVVFDNLPEPSWRVRLGASRFKEVNRALCVLPRSILGWVSAETLGKQGIAILVAFALGHAHLAGM